MTKLIHSSLPHICFADIYKHNIQYRIKEIDTYLKTNLPPYKVKDISFLLHIDITEIENIIHSKNLQQIDLIGFFKIIQTSSSYICRLIQREWKYTGRKYYTPESISYIYELNIDKVRYAFKKSGLTSVESHNLLEVFSYIYVPVINM